MDTNQPEISKSQKRKRKKVEKRRQRKEKRIAKQLLAQENSGKLIEENHNGGLYSDEFTIKAANWYFGKLEECCRVHQNDPEKFLMDFRMLRLKLQTLVLKWSDGVERNDIFYLLCNLLDTYRFFKEAAGEELLKYTKQELRRIYGN